MTVKHTIRKDGTGATTTRRFRPVKAIRAFCLECVCWQPSEVQKCTDPLCPLFPFRFGNDPTIKGTPRPHIRLEGERYRAKAQQSLLH